VIDNNDNPVFVLVHLKQKLLRMKYILLEHMIEGGVNFMLPIYLLWLSMVTLIVCITLIYIFVSDKIRMAAVVKKISEIALFFGSFAFLIGVLGSILGYYQAIDVIEKATSMPSKIMATGFKLATIPTCYGLALLILSFLVWFLFRARRNQV